MTMSGFVKLLLIFVGIALLPPGFCSLYFIFEVIRTGDSIRGPNGGIFIAIWGASFIIAALGVWLVRTAVKQPSSPAA
jgi:hypothetical protein